MLFHSQEIRSGIEINTWDFFSSQNVYVNVVNSNDQNKDDDENEDGNRN